MVERFERYQGNTRTVIYQPQDEPTNKKFNNLNFNSQGKRIHFSIDINIGPYSFYIALTPKIKAQKSYKNKESVLDIIYTMFILPWDQFIPDGGNLTNMKGSYAPITGLIHESKKRKPPNIISNENLCIFLKSLDFCSLLLTRSKQIKSILKPFLS